MPITDTRRLLHEGDIWICGCWLCQKRRSCITAVREWAAERCARIRRSEVITANDLRLYINAR